MNCQVLLEWSYSWWFLSLSYSSAQLIVPTASPVGLKQRWWFLMWQEHSVFKFYKNNIQIKNISKDQREPLLWKISDKHGGKGLPRSPATLISSAGLSGSPNPAGLSMADIQGFISIQFSVCVSKTRIPSPKHNCNALMYI